MNLDKQLDGSSALPGAAVPGLARPGASGLAVPIGAAVAASGTIAAAGTVAAGHTFGAAIASGGAIAAEAVVLAEPLDKLLRMVIDAAEHPIDPDVAVYAGSLLFALAWVIYIRHNKT